MYMHVQLCLHFWHSASLPGEWFPLMHWSGVIPQWPIKMDDDQHPEETGEKKLAPVKDLLDYWNIGEYSCLYFCFMHWGWEPQNYNKQEEDYGKLFSYST